MTTSQIIILFVLVILTIVSYWKSSLSKNENTRLLWNTFWFFISGFILVLTQTSLLRNNELSKTNNELLKQIHGKCPEFEQIQGPIYKIKNQ